MITFCWFYTYHRSINISIQERTLYIKKLGYAAYIYELREAHTHTKKTPINPPGTKTPSIQQYTAWQTASRKNIHKLSLSKTWFYKQNIVSKMFEEY